jgi:hypothetical protein
MANKREASGVVFAVMHKALPESYTVFMNGMLGKSKPLM